MRYTNTVSGKFTHIEGETFYCITNVDAIPDFFISLISDQDHWLFTGSLGGISAGRISPETAIFPYQCVDKLLDNALSTGAKTLLSGKRKDGSDWQWEPYNTEQDGRFHLTRNLYKNTLGNKLCFEEMNHDLDLRFTYTWQFSEEFGLCKRSTIENLSDVFQEITLLDGIQNILPAGTPRYTQTISSNLVDAYKYNELDESSSLALYRLYSAITDKAEPVESLKSNSVFSSLCSFSSARVQGDDLPEADDMSSEVLSEHAFIHPECVRRFKKGETPEIAATCRGVRGAYFKHLTLSIAPNELASWWIVANNEQTQSQIIDLQNTLQEQRNSIDKAVSNSVQKGSERLKRIAANADGLQVTGEQMVSQHHYANVIFNVLRGGVFAHHYDISKTDLMRTIKHFNQPLYLEVEDSLLKLPNPLSLNELKQFLKRHEYDTNHQASLLRLCEEYLPITFGRRHGDPSRPWNQFAIKLKDERGKPLLSYQGNWRDIFQNWEALCFSYPNFLDGVIAKFVNASTMDGYNPYRITKEGIDWEVEDPEDPWSYIGYWGDHQIIYLLKLLELSRRFSPDSLQANLLKPIYAYANVPYRIKAYKALCDDPKNTVIYDWEQASKIETQCKEIGADGKLVLDGKGKVVHVNLFEKLMVPLLTKLSNLVLGAGIWLNTQRPEWNDANNALVGQGVSMVTLYYTNRYLQFLEQLLIDFDRQGRSKTINMMVQVATWIDYSLKIVNRYAELLTHKKPISPNIQRDFLDAMGNTAEAYRASIYKGLDKAAYKAVATSDLSTLITKAKVLVQISIESNRGTNGLYQAYNTIAIDDRMIKVSPLYDMLEGQVAVLSAKLLSPKQALSVLEALFQSDLYRQDINTFMLYADRAQQAFLDKNIVRDPELENHPLWSKMLAAEDFRLLNVDASGSLRFNASLVNANALKSCWGSIQSDYPDAADKGALELFLNVYEQTFQHEAFTGRSTGMFAFEGLGSVYWHMVSKLLLAIQENVYDAQALGDESIDALIRCYYRVRAGIGFNHSPEVYGAFPYDPYSHTPKHAGAQQPGMTGQVKEEVLTRLGELGCCPNEGQLSFNPFMLRAQEFLTQETNFESLSVCGSWNKYQLQAGQLAFTFCQVPVIYKRSKTEKVLSCSVKLSGGSEQHFPTGSLSPDLSNEVFSRSGKVSCITVRIPDRILYQA
ncbi:hypothetical protein PN836_009750 [Ningiella sp. W23]|uniref:hypothetical protein n=1 Tax=Ningiella sp. W23 TaxID=3023715 RepID=UPI003756B136